MGWAEAMISEGKTVYSGMGIPKVFHRIWLDDPIPPKFDQYWKMFQNLHPDWEFRTWNTGEEALDFLENKALWDMVDPIAGRSDLLRYEIIGRLGGIYVDTDVEPLKSFEPLLECECPFIGWESEDRLCPTVIGSPPMHPKMMSVVEGLSDWVISHKDEKDPVIQTGPIYITEVLKGVDGFRRLPPYYFYPVGPTERSLLNGDYHPDSYSVHHWAKGWGGPSKCCGK